MAAGETEKKELTAGIGFPTEHMPEMLLYVSFIISAYRPCTIYYTDRGGHS